MHWTCSLSTQAGLHVGHPEAIQRQIFSVVSKRAHGYKSLPNGRSGLPAVSNTLWILVTPEAEFTADNIANFKRRQCA